MTIPLDKLHTLLIAIGAAVRGEAEDAATSLEELRRELGLEAVRLSLYGGDAGERVVVSVPHEGVLPPGEAWRVVCAYGGKDFGTLEIWWSIPQHPSADQRTALAMVAERIAMEAHTQVVAEATTIPPDALDTILDNLAGGNDLGGLLDSLLPQAVRITSAIGGALYMISEGDKDLRLHASTGTMADASRRYVPRGRGIVSQVTQREVLTRAQASRGTSCDGATPGHQLEIPLLGSERLHGLLSLQCAKDKPFTGPDERALVTFAAQASRAIEAAHRIRGLSAERDLREQILDGTPNGVLAVDEERQVLLMNRIARHFFADDEAAETVCGSPIARYLPQTEFLAALQRVLDGTVEEETLHLSRGTGVMELSYLIRLFRLHRGDALGATLIIQNITEQRRLDDHMQRMGRMASIGQLAAGVAHEIRNPLTGISITLDMLQEEPQLSAEGREMVIDISREIDRLESLISGLLDFARPQPAKYRPMRLAKALEWHRTFAEQCRKKDVSCIVELGPNPKIEGDPERLKQLFLNLAINALDATEPGGTVTLRTAISPTAGSDEPVRVEVADTGVGMSESTLGQVFDPFFTTKNEGTGLGLSIAHSIAEQHGGRIDIRSTPGRGTTVIVELPPHQKEKDT